MRKNIVFFGILRVTEERESDPELDPDPLIRGTNLRIRIRTKMSKIPNTGFSVGFSLN
jgi:hypothetical protein